MILITARILSLVVTFVLLMISGHLSLDPRQERTDLRPDEMADRSLRTLDPANYTRTGRRLLRINVYVRIGVLASAAVALWLFGVFSF